MAGASGPPLMPDATFTVYSVKDGQFPPTDESIYDGWIITGSPASVHDVDPPWLEALFASFAALSTGGARRCSGGPVSVTRRLPWPLADMWQKIRAAGSLEQPKPKSHPPLPPLG